MKRESSQTMLPVAVQEVCSCHLESFVTGSVDHTLKQTHIPRRSLSSLGLQRGHADLALGLGEESQVWASPWLSGVPAPRPHVPCPRLHPLWCPEYRAQEGPSKCGLKSWRHLPMGPVQLQTAGSWQMSEPCRTKSALMTYGSSQRPGRADSPHLQHSLDHTHSKSRFFTSFPAPLAMSEDIMTWWHHELANLAGGWRGAPGGWRSRLPLNILQYTRQPLKHK